MDPLAACDGPPQYQSTSSRHHKLLIDLLAKYGMDAECNPSRRCKLWELVSDEFVAITGEAITKEQLKKRYYNQKQRSKRLVGEQQQQQVTVKLEQMDDNSGDEPIHNVIEFVPVVETRMLQPSSSSADERLFVHQKTNDSEEQKSTTRTLLKRSNNGPPSSLQQESRTPDLPLVKKRKLLRQFGASDHVGHSLKVKLMQAEHETVMLYYKELFGLEKERAKLEVEKARADRDVAILRLKREQKREDG